MTESEGEDEGKVEDNMDFNTESGGCAYCSPRRLVRLLIIHIWFIDASSLIPRVVCFLNAMSSGLYSEVFYFAK
jgi:hypothetical protein